ncbi:MAG: S-layer homology domain-containing protein [Oscillospiraceae bacterium]|nr:S-layer homology domain-containing protein [Oscillospiraceae bacterium]
MNIKRTVTAIVLTVAVTAPAAYAANFADIRGHWAEHIINTLANAGVVSGVSETAFNPDGIVTRAEFLRMALGAAEIEEATYRNGECLDVRANDWFAPYVQSALDKGLIPEGMISGYSAEIEDNKVIFGGEFNGNTPIKREEMAYITQSVYQYSLREGDLQKLETPIDMPFADVSTISLWAIDGVKYAYTNELIFGMKDGNFAPQETATRAQAASIINNLLKKRGV